MIEMGERVIPERNTTNPSNNQPDWLPLKIIGLIAIPKGKKHGKAFIEGRGQLETWVDLLGKEEVVQQIQELVLGKEQRKWATTLIHGRHELVPGRCSAFYVLLPAIDALGLHDGAGAIIICATAGIVEAFGEYQKAVKIAKKAVRYRKWDEVISNFRAQGAAV